MNVQLNVRNPLWMASAGKEMEISQDTCLRQFCLYNFYFKYSSIQWMFMKSYNSIQFLYRVLPTIKGNTPARKNIKERWMKPLYEELQKPYCPWNTVKAWKSRSRTQRPRVLMRGSAAVLLLGLRVQIPPGAWMSCLLWMLCVVR